MLGFLKYLGYTAYDFAGHIASSLAAILYQNTSGDFIYTTDVSSNMILDNQGSLGATNDGLLYSGRGIELGATNDVTVGDAAKWTTWFDFADATHKTVFGIKTFNSITTNSILVSASQPSTSALSTFDTNPNLLGKLAKSVTGTIPEVDLTLVAGDEYYMCSEKEYAYLVDARTPYSADILDANAPTLDNSAGGATVTFSSTTSNTFDLAVTVVGTQNVYPRVFNNTSVAYTVGEVYILELDVTINSGTAILSQIVTDTTYTPLMTLVNGKNVFMFRAGAATTLSRLYFDGRNLFDISVTSWTIKQASAIDIANYTSTVRTNADFQQKGIQATAFVMDSIGVPTSYSDQSLLQWYGDGYVNTQKIPDHTKPFWWSSVITLNQDQIEAYEGMGIARPTNASLYMRHRLSLSRIEAKIFGTTIVKSGLTFDDSLHKVDIVFDGATTASLYYDSVLVASSAVTPVAFSEPLFLGCESSTGAVPLGLEFLKKPIGYTQYQEKNPLQSDIDADYAIAKIIHPTLP